MSEELTEYDDIYRKLKLRLRNVLEESEFRDMHPNMHYSGARLDSVAQGAAFDIN